MSIPVLKVLDCQSSGHSQLVLRPSQSVAHNLVCNVARGNATPLAGKLKDIVLEGEPVVNLVLELFPPLVLAGAR